MVKCKNMLTLNFLLYKHWIIQYLQHNAFTIFTLKWFGALTELESTHQPKEQTLRTTKKNICFTSCTRVHFRFIIICLRYLLFSSNLCFISKQKVFAHVLSWTKQTPVGALSPTVNQIDKRTHRQTSCSSTHPYRTDTKLDSNSSTSIVITASSASHLNWSNQTKA